MQVHVLPAAAGFHFWGLVWQLAAGLGERLTIGEPRTRLATLTDAGEGLATTLGELLVNCGEGLATTLGEPLVTCGELIPLATGLTANVPPFAGLPWGEKSSTLPWSCAFFLLLLAGLLGPAAVSGWCGW